MFVVEQPLSACLEPAPAARYAAPLAAAQLSALTCRWTPGPSAASAPAVTCSVTDFSRPDGQVHSDISRILSHGSGRHLHCAFPACACPARPWQFSTVAQPGLPFPGLPATWPISLWLLSAPLRLSAHQSLDTGYHGRCALMHCASAPYALFFFLFRWTDLEGVPSVCRADATPMPLHSPFVYHQCALRSLLPLFFPLFSFAGLTWRATRSAGPSVCRAYCCIFLRSACRP